MSGSARLWVPRPVAVDKRLHLSVPYGDGHNRAWLKEICGSRTRPVWDQVARGSLGAWP